jgi:hypothetical protein
MTEALPNPLFERTARLLRDLTASGNLSSTDWARSAVGCTRARNTWS